LKDKRKHDVEVDHDSVVWSLDPTQDQMHRLWAHYLGNVTLIDEKVGELLEALKERGYLDDAIVIFTSDHGECLGEHGLIQKWSMYDIVTRVPTIIWSTRRAALRGVERSMGSASCSISVRPSLSMQASRRRNHSRRKA
jgi:arylsulfatase